MTKQNKGRKLFATTATAALVASAIVPVASAASFNDAGNIPTWATDAVNRLADSGVLEGDTKGNFNPNGVVTRAQAATIFYKALGLQATGGENFADVDSDDWWYDAVVATSPELFQGDGTGKFLPKAQLTRAEAAKVIVAAYGLKGEADLSTFSDASSVKAWAKDSFSAAVANGVINGKGTKLAPNDSITRAEFATMVARAIDADSVASNVESVTAINATTVEVNFKNPIEDIEALDFLIDGLDVTNAVVKQTDNSVAVLTTATQEAGKEYTVTSKGETLGKFKGVSAVIPTGIDLTTKSVQGKLGQQVTVSAQVTVAEGASKAGIPVTFNVPGDDGTLSPKLTAEVTTNEHGVATYSYTRYADRTDTVTAYASGDRSKFSTGYVFWGVDTILKIEEVTTGATINNGANKTYKVTYKHPETGKTVAGKVLNVSALENINVTADKLQNVTINGESVSQLSNGTKTVAAQITTDSKGEATFTVSGSNAVVTPVVFEANNTATTKDFKYEASDLQATAAKVEFSAVQAAYKIELTRDGGEVAATGEANGREYKVVVKDKDGKVAKNETVNIAFNEDLDRVISTNTKAGFVNPDTDKFYPTSGTGNTNKQISVKTDDKGEAKFVIATDSLNENDYATPLAWIDINSANAKSGSLDEGEPKTVAQITHFQAPYLDGAEIKAFKTSGGKAVTKFDGNEVAEFKAELVNQSGKAFTGGYTLSKITYTVFNTGANDVKVGNTVISPNRSETFTTNGESLKVESAEGKTTSVRVVATGSAAKDGKDYAFTAKEATATFTATREVPNSYTGEMAQYNPADSGTNSNSIWFAGKDPVKYAGVTGKTFKYFGANGNEVFGEKAWEELLAQYDAANQDVTASYIVDGDTITFKIITVGAASGVATDGIQQHAPAAANNAPVAKTVGDQSVALNGTPLTFTATQVASDADTADTLKIVTAYTDNATVATTAVAAGQLSFTVTPATAGSTNVTVVVTDGKETVNVNFKVNVSAASYTTLLGNPARAYVAPKASTVLLTSPTVTTAGDITVGDGSTSVNVNLAAGASVADIATAINAQASSLVTAVVKGADVELTSKATGVTITTADASSIGTGLAKTGTNGAAVAAQYTFKVDSVPTTAKTFKVAVGSDFYEYTSTGTEVSAAALASAIQAELATKVAASNANAVAFDAKYTVAVTGDVITITQKSAASTTSQLSVTAQ
ncbi:S-layer homology domain-containing protein [Ureibacillus sinduriensis]|uniref:SLH domain-containing protein n=1 Tax=Ureibacillus sinduriensis BLB-1 = JCM 15800 TaxID=1384057 RepID=A0A0A3I033_9BACL|nr:S-layer homology domain-containing protein [Ureibacillus sinduriensis]KGR76003.1 hypothetical protein CD33_09200 [Ureibacillus sinduriensis BLB-1 = JCM 15800]